MTQQRIQAIISEIAARLDDSDQHLVTTLMQELARLQLPGSSGNQATAVSARLDKETGCYLFDNDPAYYCPLCFDRQQQKVATRRLNRNLRVCPQCRSSLRPQR